MFLLNKNGAIVGGTCITKIRPFKYNNLGGIYLKWKIEIT